MATATFTGTGNWDDATGKWAGGGGTAGQPLAIDDAVIAKNSTCTLNITTAVCNSLTIEVGTTGADVGGKILASTSASSKLVVEKGLNSKGSTGGTSGSYSSTVELDMSGASAHTCEVLLNNSNGSGTSTSNAALTVYGILSGRFILKGSARTRWSVTTQALIGGNSDAYPNATTGIWTNVSDATGWEVNDRVVLISTQAYNATPRVDVLTISSLTSLGGTAYRVVFTGAATYDHATDCVIGNFTSNLKLGPATAGQNGAFLFSGGATQNGTSVCNHVEFAATKAPDTFRGGFGGFLVSGVGLTSFQNNAFYDFSGVAVSFHQLSAATGTRANNVFYSTRANCVAIGGNSNVGTADTGDENTFVIFRAASGLDSVASGCKYVGGYVSGCTTYGDSMKTSPPLIDCHVFGNAIGKEITNGTVRDIRWLRTSVGTRYSGATNATAIQFESPAAVTLEDCPFSVSGAALAAGLTSCGANGNAYIKLLNKGDGTQTGISAAVQEVYRNTSNSAPVLTRDAVTYNMATSSMKVDFIGTANIAQSYEVAVPVKSGAALTILLYVRKTSSYKTGSYSEPYAQLTGLGITDVTVTATAASDNAWELLTVSYGSGAAPSADGNLTLTLVAQSATNGAACYWSGMPVAPFVSRCRHYGYLFDETTITRTANITIDSGINESAALAYGNSGTDLEVTWGAVSSLAIKADSTFKKIYHFTQADACRNVASALPLTGAGVANSPALFAAGNVTVSATKTLNGSGSLAMGGHALTANDSFSYTYTGGTFSQATTVPAFSGGTLNIGVAGIYTFTQAAAMILSMTPTAPGTYALGDSTFTGQVDLRNTAAHAITVELPTGTSYTTASNTGGTITVSLPVITADISITGMSDTLGANNRLQIINSTAIAASDWQAATAYATGDVVLRTSGIGSESTAGLYFRATTGGTSHATTEPTWDTAVGNTTTDGTVVWTCYKVLYYDADPAATSLTDTYIDGEEFLAGETVEIRFAEEDPAVSFKTYSTSVVATADGFSALVNETDDSSYATYATSGVTQDSIFSPNFVSNYIVLDTNTNFTASGAYAYYCYLLTTSDGMYRFWGGLTGIDPGNIRNNSSVVSLYFDCSSGFVRQTDDIRIFRSDGLRPALDPVTAEGGGIEINWKVPVNVVSIATASVLSPAESAQLMALPSATAIAQEVVTGITF